MVINQLHLGDNLAVLRDAIDDASIDLIYLDPPFNSGAMYEVNPRTAKAGAVRSAFDDTWRWDGAAAREFEELIATEGAVGEALPAIRTLIGTGSLLAYLTRMAPRLAELHRALKPTGSIYLHCNHAACHYLKVLMDAVFGVGNFLNHIVWLYGLGGSSPRYWPRKHDDILWYSREPGRHYFDPVMVPASSNRMKGQLKKAPDYWHIPTINNMARERMGYPTQKPEALLERIVESSSRPGDIVLDPFCGGGTTLAVAQRLGRSWIGIDIAPAAIDLTALRLGASAADQTDAEACGRRRGAAPMPV